MGAFRGFLRSQGRAYFGYKTPYFGNEIKGIFCSFLSSGVGRLKCIVDYQKGSGKIMELLVDRGVGLKYNIIAN